MNATIVSRTMPGGDFRPLSRRPPQDHAYFSRLHGVPAFLSFQRGEAAPAPPLSDPIVAFGFDATRP